jgi:hypothetical protein
MEDSYLGGNIKAANTLTPTNNNGARIIIALRRLANRLISVMAN